MSLDLLISPYSSQNRYEQHQLRIMLQAEAKQQCFCGRGRMGWKKKCITNECITNRVVQNKAWRPPKYLISPQAGTQSAGLAYIYCTSLSYNKRTKKYIYLRAFFFFIQAQYWLEKTKPRKVAGMLFVVIMMKQSEWKEITCPLAGTEHATFK